MKLKYAKRCNACGTRRTKDPSGVCCRCRRIQRKTFGQIVATSTIPKGARLMLHKDGVYIPESAKENYAFAFDLRETER